MSVEPWHARSSARFRPRCENSPRAFCRPTTAPRGRQRTEERSRRSRPIRPAQLWLHRYRRSGPAGSCRERRRAPPSCSPTKIPSNVTGRVPKALERRSRAWRPQRSGRTTRRKVWSFAPADGVGNAKRWSGCAEGFPMGSGPCTEAVQLVVHGPGCARAVLETRRRGCRTGHPGGADQVSWLAGRHVVQDLSAYQVAAEEGVLRLSPFATTETFNHPAC